MTEERLLLSSGMPLEDAISMCNDLRREGAQPVKTVERNEHACACGGKCSCPDCPGRNE